MKKPTGKSGPISAKITKSGEFTASFEKIQFPDDKDEIESYVVSCFVDSGKEKFGKYFFISDPKKNTLDDFDFLVTTPKGNAYLELMEIAPLELYRGGYKDAPNCIDRYDISKFVHSKILEKSEKYPNKLSKELYLLLYVTDYKFSLSDVSRHILSYFCYKSSIKFDVIFSYTPHDEKEGVVNWIHPSEDKEFEGFDPEQFMGENINLDPEKFVVDSSKITNKKLQTDGTKRRP